MKHQQTPAHAFRCAYRVPYAETDAMGRVYYANYLIWFERGRTELLRAAGHAYRQLEAEGVYLPVRSCRTRYFSHIRYDDEIELANWVAELRRARVTMATNVSRDGALAATGLVELACVDAAGKPRALPESLRACLEDYCAGAEPA